MIWIINTTPFIFALFAALIGVQTRRLQEASRQLAEQFRLQSLNLKNEYHFFQALITSSPFAVVQLDTDHKIVACNPAFEELFDYTEEEIIGRLLDKIVASEELHAEASGLSREVTSGNIVRLVSRRKKADGSLFDVEIFGVPVIVGGEKIGALAMYHNISDRVAAENAIQNSEARFRSLFDNSPISLWEEDFSQIKAHLGAVAAERNLIEALETDDDLVQECIGLVQVLDVNQATLDLFHANSKQELMIGLENVITEEALESFRQELLTLARGETYFETEIVQRKMNGETIHGWLRLSIAPGYENTWEKVFISILDITARKKTEDNLRFLSFHDSLTGLYNRAFFEEEVNRLENSRQFPVSLINFDLDDLKGINDTHGHDAGDKALCGAASILKNVFRHEDMVARLGGDEFAVILPNTNIEDTPSIIERLEASIETYNTAEDHGFYRPISFSFGYVSIPVGGSLLEGFKLADQRMYTIKHSKKKDQN